MEHERRPALRYNKKLAEEYGINPDIPDPPRETVRVARIPDPPEVQAPRTARPAQAELNVEEAIVNVLKEEFDELRVRLERFGVDFDTKMQQELVDITMALLGGSIGGGALARRE